MGKTQHIKKGDQVLVLSGDDGPHGGRVGRRGRVVQVLPDKDRLVVEGVNIVIKHRRGGRRQVPSQIQTGRIEMPAAVHRSKVMLVCPRCDRPTRVRMRVAEDGVRSRVCHRCEEVVDQV